MRVAVISTADRGGATAATLLIGYALAYKCKEKVRLCYTGYNEAIKKYAGRGRDDRDATRTISQVSKLLQAHAIAPEELGDYCMKLGPNYELMDSTDEALTEEETTELLNYVYTRSTSDFILCDVAGMLDEEATQSILNSSDAIILISEASAASLDQAHEMVQEDKLFPKDVPTMLLITRYHEQIAPLKWCANKAGVKMRHTCKLHFSPYIVRGCNNMDLESVARAIFDRDPRVIELNNDLKECVQFLLTINSPGQKVRWEE